MVALVLVSWKLNVWKTILPFLLCTAQINSARVIWKSYLINARLIVTFKRRINNLGAFTKFLHVMSDIGSDSDATIADSVEEEDVSNECSSPNTYTAEITYPDCTSSLQKGQRILLDKLEKITPETTTVQYGNCSFSCNVLYVSTVTRTYFKLSWPHMQTDSTMI